MNSTTAKRIFLMISLLVVLPIAGKLDQVQAQIQVSLVMNKKVYMTHEAMAGQLVIVNRSGGDLVLDGSNGSSWLDYQVTDFHGDLISPIRGRPGMAPVMIRAGQTYKKQVYVNQRYPMGQTGVYRIRASVYFPPLRRYFRTKIQSVQVTEGRVIWPRTVGVPPGYPGEGTYRKYEVIRFDHQRQKELYFRLSEADSGRVIATYSLGQLLMVTEPKMGVDTQNRLHILHMGAPLSSAHTIIDVEGKVVSQKFYFSKGENRPTLVRIGNGDLVIDGGISEEMQDSVYEKNEFHKLSELPPGMPIN